MIYIYTSIINKCWIIIINWWKDELFNAEISFANGNDELLNDELSLTVGLDELFNDELCLFLCKIDLHIHLFLSQIQLMVVHILFLQHIKSYLNILAW